MSATHEELSSFTHRQLRQYTHDDLEKMSLDELVELAKIELDRKTPDRLVATLKAFLRDVAVDLVANGAKALLIELVKYIFRLP